MIYRRNPKRSPDAAAERQSLRAALASRTDAMILESAPGFGELGRWSLYAAFPRAAFQVRGSQWSLTQDWPGARPSASLDPFGALRFLLQQTASPLKPAEASSFPFRGGWIGFIGYDVGELLERVPRRHASTSLLPDVQFAYYDTFALHDSRNDDLAVFAEDRFGEGETAARRRREAFEDLAASAFSTARDLQDPREPLVKGPLESNFTPDEYCTAVARILDYLRAGDIFQVNLAQRFTGRFDGSIEALYARCFRQSPAPFGALIRHPDWTVVSTSPERFFRLTPDRHVETRPIKGTRPRGHGAIHDLLLREELQTSAKDHAELTMIVDLERNDLGRVCEFGSISVARHADVESYANVHHLVSTVEGRLRSDADVVDLLRAMFPGGSITGAPKIRAMEIIDEIERCRRGVYTGAIGYLSDHGQADFNIAIRTLVVDRDAVHFHVGGGIVIDSDPLGEYRETLAKGKRIREVLMGSRA